jgi:hypothetical protein
MDLEHDHPEGLTLAEAARRFCDNTIHEAIAAAEAEAARFEAMDRKDPPGSRPDTQRALLKVIAYQEAGRLQDQLREELHRRLRLGELVATARERPIGPRGEVAAAAWAHLYPHMNDDTARDGMGALVLFQVRIAEPADPSAAAAQVEPAPPAVTGHAGPKPRSLSTIRAWYLLRVAEWSPAYPAPGEAKDLAAAKQHYGVSVPRAQLRAIRRELAPAAWKKPGARRPPR